MILPLTSLPLRLPTRSGCVININTYTVYGVVDVCILSIYHVPVILLSFNKTYLQFQLVYGSKLYLDSNSKAIYVPSEVTV